MCTGFRVQGNQVRAFKLSSSWLIKIIILTLKDQCVKLELVRAIAIAEIDKLKTASHFFF